MKDSGIEWIGEIPVDWECSRISSLYSEQNTKVSDKDYVPLSVTKQGIVLQLDSAAKTDDGDNRKLVCKGDFVINSRSDRRGSCGISDYDGSVSLINTVIHPNRNVCNDYFQFAFKTERFADEYFRWGNGIVDDLWSTKWSAFKRIGICCPRLDVQLKIADFLHIKCARIDSTIQKQKSVIEKLKQYKQAIITEAVTKGLDPTVKMKPSGVEWIGEIPAPWIVGKLKHFATLRSGLTLGKKYPRNAPLVEYPYLRVANVQIDFVDLTNVATIYVTPEEAENYSLRIGEVLMTEGGDRDKLGRGCIWNGEIEGCLHQNHVFAVRVDLNRLSTRFFNYLTTSDVGRQYFDYTAKKTTNLASTNSTTILNFLIPIPSIGEQNEIVEYLDNKCCKVDDYSSGKQKIIDKLIEYKKSLIYECVTGKREVG